jgi:hypothetical protein
MSVLTNIPNGASYKDIRDTLNSVLARLAELENGASIPVPTPTFLNVPTISSDGTPQVGKQLTGVDAAVSNLGTNTLTRAWLNGTTVLTSSANFIADAVGTRSFRNQIVSPGGTVLATTSASVTIAAATPTPTPTLPAIQLAYVGANPNATYPPPLSIALPPEYEPGDVLRLYIDTGYDSTGATSVTHPLTDADAAGGSISFGTAISSITSGIHAFAIRAERGSMFSPTSPTLVHGDAVAPTLTFTPSSTAEQLPMLITLTASEPSYFAIGSSDASLVEKVGSEPATSIGIRLLGNALLDYEAKAAYSLTATSTDRGMNIGSPTAINFAVIDKDEVPTAVTVASVENAPAGSYVQAAAPFTVSGLDAGISTSIASTNGGLLSKNGGTPISSATVVNGDTVRVGLQLANGQSTVNFSYGGTSFTFTASTGAAVTTTTWNGSPRETFVYSNANRTLSCVAGTADQPQSAGGAVSETSGSWRIEWKIDAAQNSSSTGRLNLGLATATGADSMFFGLDANSISYYDGGIIGNGGAQSGYPTYATGDTITLDYSFVDGSYTWRRGGVLIYSGTWTPSGAVTPIAGITSGDTVSFATTTTPPSGYKHWGN